MEFIPDKYWCPVGHVNRAQAEALRQLALSVDARHCLEVGFATGRSLAAVYFGCLPDTLVSIDKDLDYRKEGRPMAELMRRELRGVEIIERDTWKFDFTTLFNRSRGWVDFAFIDGDHSAEGCLNDLLGVFPLICQGGLIVVDDYESGPPDGVTFPGVNFAVNSFCKEFSLSLNRWKCNGKGMAVIKC